MTKEEIQKNSEHWYNKYKDAEKRITDLEKDKAYAEEQLDEQIQATLNLQKENAGLKAGRPQWHKVADGDLPTTVGRRFLVSNRYCSMIGYWNGKTFVSADEDTTEIANPIAWCEIPTFDKE